MFHMDFDFVDHFDVLLVLCGAYFITVIQEE